MDVCCEFVGDKIKSSDKRRDEALWSGHTLLYLKFMCV